VLSQDSPKPLIEDPANIQHLLRPVRRENPLMGKSLNEARLLEWMPHSAEL
jgi:hypothetical protein